MSQFKDIKQILTNTQVVEKYLGQPIKSTNLGNWYKSPFRDERTASFCVSDTKGIHDFGDSSHYDIISFTSKYFNISSLEALQTLKYDFNLLLDNEYQTNKTLEMAKEKRRLEQAAKEKVKNWYNSKYQELCDENFKVKRCIEIFENKHYYEPLQVLYAQQVALELQISEFINAKENDKIDLYFAYKED